MMIDEKTVEQARNADLIAFLGTRYGFTFTHQGGAFRCEQHKSLAVKDDRRSWYWHSKGIGGYGALDFLIIGECMPFREAISTLTGIAPIIAPPRQPEPPKTLILPEKAGIPLRLYDYLCKKRGIDGNIVNSLIQKKTLYEDKRGNVVFVAYDEQCKPRFAYVRGTHGDFRGDCSGSDKRYGFSMPIQDAERLYLFESAIDLLSHATLAITGSRYRSEWTHDSRLSLAGVTDTAIPKYLEKYPYTKELVFCLDNDEAGREASAAMKRKYADKGYKTWAEPPFVKDYNVDLTDKIREARLERQHKAKDEPCL